MRKGLWAASIGVLVGTLTLTSVVIHGQAAGRAPSSVVRDGPGVAQRIRSGEWNRFSVRVVVRREIVRDGGFTGYQPMTDEYVYQREKTGRGWRTRVQVVSGTAPTIRTRLGETLLPGDLGVGAMEDDEDGTAPRFFTRAGVEIRQVSPERRQRLAGGGPPGVERQWLEWAGSARGAVRRGTGDDWVKAFVMSSGDRQPRLARATGAFGRRAGWLRGYGRYVKTAGHRSVELLMDEANAVPVEANVVERGTLRSHTRFDYERLLDGTLVRRGVHLERAMSADEAAFEPSATRGGRRVTVIRYADLQLTKGGR